MCRDLSQPIIREVGRCGRDGQQAQGILLFDEVDKKIQEYFIDSAQPSIQDFKLVLDSIEHSEIPPGITDIKRMTGLHPTRVAIVISELLEQGFITKRSEYKKQLYSLTKQPNKLDLSRYENQFRVRTFELSEMIHYGKKSSDCLMKILRKALGDLEANNCGHCSVCSKTQYSINKTSTEKLRIDAWLSSRTSAISLSTKSQIAEGVAVLNAQLRSPIFINFMKTRTSESVKINQELLEFIKQQLLKLKQKYSIGSIITLPSRTWSGRNHVAQVIADVLGVKLFNDYLEWKTQPHSRQGELLNNDQRRHNVDQHMHANKQINVPRGAILLLDDYVGSGATLQEAGRVLCKEAKLNNTIIPFTIAVVKWRLGKRGMI